jgi:hypothetical protein
MNSIALSRASFLLRCPRAAAAAAAGTPMALANLQHQLAMLTPTTSASSGPCLFPILASPSSHTPGGSTWAVSFRHEQQQQQRRVKSAIVLHRDGWVGGWDQKLHQGRRLFTQQAEAAHTQQHPVEKKKRRSVIVSAAAAAAPAVTIGGGLTITRDGGYGFPVFQPPF